MFFASCSFGTRVENCLFLANDEWWQGTYGPLTATGPLTFELEKNTNCAEVVNCTFAYNSAGGTTDTCGIRVNKGTVDVANCIFYGAMTGTSHSVGAAIHATGESTVTVRYSMAESPDDFTAASGATLTLGAGLVYGDPRFATPASAFGNLTEAYTATYGSTWYLRRYKKHAVVASAIMAASAHLRGKQGYLDEGTGRDVHWRGERSPAIDAGDPATSYSRESQPNNRRVNLGCYGNTPYATRSGGGVRAVVR